MTEYERLEKALKVAFLKKDIHKKSEMAAFLGYNNTYLSGLLNGKGTITEKFLDNISDRLNINPAWIKKGEGEMLKTVEYQIANPPFSMVEETQTSYQTSYNTVSELLKNLSSLVESNTILAESNRQLVETNNNLSNELLEQIRGQRKSSSGAADAV